SVGSRNSQSVGNAPAWRASSVSLRQKSSASAKLTLPTGKLSPAGNSAVSSPGSAPATDFHCPCVASYLAIQNPLVSLTSVWFSSGRRSGSLSGLPMTNLPGGHHCSLMPSISRSSPALEPSKAVEVGGAGACDSCPQPSGLNARRASEDTIPNFIAPPIGPTPERPSHA